MKNLTDYIFIVENAVPSQLCDDILGEYIDCDEWHPAAVGDGVTDKSIRDVDKIETSHPSSIRGIQSRVNLDHKLFLCVSNGLSKYREKFPHCALRTDTGYELLRYKRNQKYTEHTDSFIDHPRELTASIALNDDYKGGEFSILGGDFEVKIPRGGMLMFPSNFMYPHQILPVTEGIRYSIVTWFR